MNTSIAEDNEVKLVGSLGDLVKTNLSPIQEICKAVKRAKFFTKNIEWSGESLPLSSQGLAIPVRNWFWLLYLVSNEETTEERYRYNLFILWQLSISINKWIDNHLIENDDDAKAALVSFLGIANQWANWQTLEKF